MIEAEPQVADLSGDLQRVLSKLFSVLRRGDPRSTTGGDLTLAQLSILLTLLDQGPIRMTELAARERVRTPTTTVAIRRLKKLGLVKRSRDPRIFGPFWWRSPLRVWCSTARRWRIDARIWHHCFPSSATRSGRPLPRRFGRWNSWPISPKTRPSQASRALRRLSRTVACCPAVRR